MFQSASNAASWRSSVSAIAAVGAVKVALASETVSPKAFLAAAIVSADGVNAVRLVGAVVPAFAFVDVLALGNRQGGFEAVLTLARVRPHRVDALAPRRTVIRAETALVHVVTSGAVAFKPGVAHALWIIAGQTGGVGMTHESVPMRTAES